MGKMGNKQGKGTKLTGKPGKAIDAKWKEFIVNWFNEQNPDFGKVIEVGDESMKLTKTSTLGKVLVKTFEDEEEGKESENESGEQKEEKERKGSGGCYKLTIIYMTVVSCYETFTEIYCYHLKVSKNEWKVLKFERDEEIMKPPPEVMSTNHLEKLCTEGTVIREGIYCITDGGLTALK